MSATVRSKTDKSALNEKTIHDVLRNDRRRLVLESLREGGGTATVSDLAKSIAAVESDERPPPRNKRQSVYVSLHQTHLPKLDSLGIVSYDSDDREVELLDRIEEVEVYMEVVPQYGLSWGEFYFGWGLLGLLTVIGVRIGVPVLSGVDLLTLWGVLFAGLMIASAYHVYSQQNRVLFQRLFR